MNRNDVIDVLTAVAAASRRSVGETDVDVWQAVIGEVAKQHALQALRDHLREQPGVWIEPGHVYQRARTLRRNELEKEEDALREARQAALDARFADQAAEIAASKGQGRPERGPNPLTVECPWCHAAPLTPCTTPGWPVQRPQGGYHPARVAAVRETVKESA